MKTKLLFLTTLLTASVANAQVPNSGFETITSDNHVSQWAKSYMISITADTTGEFHGDSIVFENPDNQLYRSTTDAHSGQFAMEMTNGYNYTGNFGYVGGAFLASSEFYSAMFPEMVAIDPVQPETFSFYYKYFPLATDSAQAIFTAYDIDGFQIGEASVQLGGTVSSYTLVSLPIVYTDLQPVNYISVSFATAIPGNQPTLGTRFLVDDVVLSGNLGLNDNSTASIKIYPNPSTEFFQVAGMNDAKISVTTMDGSSVPLKITADGKIDCKSWSAGTYFVHIKNNESSITEKLVVSH